MPALFFCVILNAITTVPLMLRPTVWMLLAVLLLVACESGRNREMSVLIDRADSLNRSYVPMTDGIDSLLLEAVEYYDRHGTRNEQMRAHYLLGCSYRDLGEAPAALQSYQDAVDRADTISSECDYKLLMKIYGQMAGLFHIQNLPNDELDAIQHVQNCAELTKDTLTSIRCVELKVKPYYLLHDTIAMLNVLHQAQLLYLKNGYLQEASSIYPPIIDLNLSHDSLEKAKRLMDLFETKSGLFDSAGNISSGRETYYELKGLYYYKVHKLDSAEYYYRKLQQHSLMTGAYCGLLSVYKDKANTDSIIKYARLFAEGAKLDQDALRTQTIHQMSSMYNYQRFLKKADSERRRAERFSYYFLLSTFLIILLAMISIYVGFVLLQKKKKKERENEKLRKDYEAAIDKKDQLAEEVDMLKANNEHLIVSEQETKMKLETVKANNYQLMYAKEKEIAALNEKIREYAKRLLHSDKTIGGNPQFTLLIDDFHQKALRKRKTSLPTRLEWEEFLKLFVQTQPQAYVAIGRSQTLSPQELSACVLLLLKFTNSEILSLLNISPQSLTNIKTRINEKLFGEPKASSLDSKMKKIPIV